MKKPQIIPMILEQTEMELKDEWRPERLPNSFRGSELGDCPRFIQYRIRGYEGEPISTSLGLLFKDGHLHHDAVRRELSKIGRVTNVEFSIFREYSVEIGSKLAKFTLTGTIDGLFNGDYIFDIKSINPFSFKKLSLPYIMENYRGYVYQLQSYMAGMDKEWSFNLFKDKAFSGMKIFWYQRSQKIFQRVLNKCAKIQIATEANQWIKRPFAKSSTQCERCTMRIHCWNKPMKVRK